MHFHTLCPTVAQEASSIFRRELADKNQQLELLREEIK